MLAGGRSISSSGLRIHWHAVVLALLAWLYTLPFIHPMLGSYWSGDDLMNLYYHRYSNPPSSALSESVMFWTTYRRPVGGLVYLALYSVFGLTDPVPYYATGLGLFTLNVFLLFSLLLRLTRNATLSALGTAIASIHREIGDIWFNFGAVYELLACGLMLGAFHAYWNARDAATGSRQKAWYVSALVLYVLAIGGKEVAATLPAVLLLFELLYPRRAHEGPPRRWRVPLALGPFFLVGVIAALGKTFGQGAVALESPAYEYHVSVGILENLATYVEKLFFHHVQLNVVSVGVLMILSLGLAALLRNRHLLLGWFVFHITLLPVLGLPRNWGLFLYIPLIGVGLYVAALLAAVAGACWRRAPRIVEQRLPEAAAAALALVAMLALLMWIHLPVFASMRREVFIERGESRRAHTEQLFERFPDLPARSVVALRESPYEHYDLHFAIWLHYGKPQIEVLAGPTYDPERFRRLVERGRVPYALEYRSGRLVELRVEDIR